MLTGTIVLLITLLATLSILGYSIAVPLLQRRAARAAIDAPPPAPLPSRHEMRRHMIFGLYCNADDPRVLVPRPRGRGWTINIRGEELAMAFWVMLALTIVTALVVALMAKAAADP